MIQKQFKGRRRLKVVQLSASREAELIKLIDDRCLRGGCPTTPTLSCAPPTCPLVLTPPLHAATIDHAVPVQLEELTCSPINMESNAGLNFGICATESVSSEGGASVITQEEIPSPPADVVDSTTYNVSGSVGGGQEEELPQERLDLQDCEDLIFCSVKKGPAAKARQETRESVVRSVRRSARFIQQAEEGQQQVMGSVFAQKILPLPPLRRKREQKNGGEANKENPLPKNQLSPVLTEDELESGLRLFGSVCPRGDAVRGSLAFGC